MVVGLSATPPDRMDRCKRVMQRRPGPTLISPEPGIGADGQAGHGRVVPGGQVVPEQWILLEREVLIGAQIVDAELAGSWLFGGGLLFEEQHIGFYALGVEDAGGKTQHGV